MNYGEIKKCDIANGEGVRVTLFVSGCTHHCKGCFNPETWDFQYGEPFTQETCGELLESLAPEYIAGLTLLGGEPFEVGNQRALTPFLRKMKELYPRKDIWCYTGYTPEADLSGAGSVQWESTGDKDADCEEKDGAHTGCGQAQCMYPRCECTDEMLSLIDVLVDGEFVEEKKDISLVFRGSSNQRLIDLPETLRTGRICLWESRMEKTPR